MNIPIHSWDVVTINNKRVPVLEIEPTQTKLVNSFTISIQNTDSCYDEIVDDAHLELSPFGTGKLVIVPHHIGWQGYPEQLGSVSIQIFTPEEEQQIVEQFKQEQRNREQPIDNRILTCSFICILIIMLIINDIQ